MFKQLLSLFGFGPKVDFAEIVRNGSIILDVRTAQEFRNGHINGAINISLQDIQKNKLGKIKNLKDRTIITCCRSGGRSRSAKMLLTSKGFTDVYNGGGWMSLDSQI